MSVEELQEAFLEKINELRGFFPGDDAVVTSSGYIDIYLDTTRGFAMTSDRVMQLLLTRKMPKLLER